MYLIYSHMNLIVAIDTNNGIGINNALPWKFKSDLKYFMKLTKGSGNNCVVMGKNTFLSIGKPLTNRTNIVLSSSLTPHENTLIFQNFSHLKEYFNSHKYDQIWIIGGLQIYQLFLQNNLIQNVYITHILQTYSLCDTFFPYNIISHDFEEDTSYTHKATEQHIDLIYKKYVKTNTSSTQLLHI